MRDLALLYGQIPFTVVRIALADIQPGGSRHFVNGKLPLALGRDSVNLLSKHQFLLAVLGGGLAGLAAAAAIGMLVGDHTADAGELFAGAWMGFALSCATMMITNAGRHRNG